MGKVKFYFNTKSLTYEKVQLKWTDRLFKLLSYLATGIVFAVATVLIAYNFIDSPKEKQLKRQIKSMQYEYDLLNSKMDEVQMVLNSMQERDDNIYRMIFESEPLPENMRSAGFGGIAKYREMEERGNPEMVIETAKRLDKISKAMVIQSKSFDKVVELAKNKKQLLACMPAIQPLQKNKVKHMSGFGYRMHPIYKTQDFHPGIDFSAPLGTPIYATGDGTVTLADSRGDGYGIHVVINHGFGFQTLYGHMSKTKARVGQKVKRGEVIGYVGSTGLSTAPHVHYEIIKSGNKINPINYFYKDLSPAEYQALIERAEQSNQSFD